MVVGLGNPGRRYENTPHNAGFAVLDILAERLECSLRRSWRFDARKARTDIGGADVHFVQPLSFMNNSGRVVAAVLRSTGATPEDLIVVVDDADIDLGKIRVRSGGGSGGHRGLDSVISVLGTGDFVRVRMGIGRSKEDLVDHVLSPLSGANMKVFREMAEHAANAVLSVIGDGVDVAMNRFNGTKEKSGG